MILVRDEFTGTGTLESHTPDTQTGGVWLRSATSAWGGSLSLNGSGAVNTNTSAERVDYQRTETALQSYIDINLQSGGGSADNYGIRLRKQGPNGAAYCFGANENATTLYYFDGSGYTAMKTDGTALPSVILRNQLAVLHCEVKDDVDGNPVCKIVFDGSTMLTFTDTAKRITTAGSFRIEASVQGGVFDYLEFGTIGSSNVAPTVTTHPSNATVPEGANASFTAAFAGTPTPTLQWQSRTSSGGTWADISGETSATLNLSAVTTALSGYQFRCGATNSVGGPVYTNAATLIVNALPGVDLTNATNYTVKNGAGTIQASKEFDMVFYNPSTDVLVVKVTKTTDVNGLFGVVKNAALTDGSPYEIKIRATSGSPKVLGLFTATAAV